MSIFSKTTNPEGLSSQVRGKDGGIMDAIRCDEKDFLIWKWRPNSMAEAGASRKENNIRPDFRKNQHGKHGKHGNNRYPCVEVKPQEHYRIHY